MKTTTIRMLAALLALTNAVGALCACQGEGEASQRDSQTSSAATSEAEPEVSEKAAEIAENASDVYKNVEVDTKIKWMAWYDADEKSSASDIFRALYGTPENCPEGYEDTPAENIFVNISVSTYAERYTALATAVQSGASPDCFPFEISNYPYGIYENLFQSIDGVVDLTTDEWAERLDVIEMFNWGGKNYCPIMEISVADLLWYRTSVVTEAGLDDPWTLYENGEWTWSKFLELCRAFTDTEKGKWALDGYNPENALVASTGVPLIGIEDGRLVSNMDNQSIEKCMEMLVLFDDTNEQLRYPRENENNWSPSMTEWVDGNVLFYEDGPWRYEEHWYKYKTKNEWDDNEISFVPFPKMDETERYYHLMKQDSVMLCAGSQNAEGYKALIYATLLAKSDEELTARERDKAIETYNWTEALLDRLDLLNAPDTFSPVFDFKNGIGADIAGTGTSDTAVEKLTKNPYMYGRDYATTREIVKGEIDARIELINSSIQ